MIGSKRTVGINGGFFKGEVVVGVMKLLGFNGIAGAGRTLDPDGLERRPLDRSHRVNP